MSIQLHIERLVLEGLTIKPDQRAHLQAALELELERLLTAGGLAETLQSGGSLPSLPAAPLHMPPGLTGVELGRQIARTVYGGLGDSRPNVGSGEGVSTHAATKGKAI